MKFDDDSMKQWPNYSPARFTNFYAVFCTRLDADSDVIIRSMFVVLIVHNEAAKFRDPRLNSCRVIRPIAVGSGIFDHILNSDTADRK